MKKKLKPTSDEAIGNPASNGSTVRPSQDALDYAGELDLHELTRVLVEMRQGNFSVRMPVDKIGMSGKVCDIVNDILFFNERLLTTNMILQREIEERKASEVKVRELNHQLTENNAQLKTMYEELDQFAYMASHDLQEPLRKIQLFSDKIIAKKVHDKDAEHYFSRIISASRRMQSLINNLLDFSKHSIKEADFERIDLNQLVKETLSQLEMEIEKSKAVIHYDKLPIINAAPELMQQLFYNLINNALKFSKKSVAPVITIKVGKMPAKETAGFIGHAHGKPFFKITISDNGIGFDDKHSQEIFKVFKRLHNYQQYEGTGVGLAICKKIIEKHGGFIRAESVPDGGTSFIIGLPESQLIPVAHQPSA